MFFFVIFKVMKTNQNSFITQDFFNYLSYSKCITTNSNKYLFLKSCFKLDLIKNIFQIMFTPFSGMSVNANETCIYCLKILKIFLWHTEKSGYLELSNCEYYNYLVRVFKVSLLHILSGHFCRYKS